MRGTTQRSVRVVGLAGTALLASMLIGGIASGQDEAPISPSISGDPAVGSTLTASPGDVFQWQRCLPTADVPDACGPDRNSPGWQTINGAGGQDADTYVPVVADIGHLIRVEGKGAPIGTQFVPSAAVGPVFEPPPPPPPPPAELRGEAPPIFDVTGNVEPTQGTVQVQLPNGEVHEIHRVTQIPVGSIVDVSNGHAILTTQRKPGGPLQSTEEWGAPFKFDQKAKRALTVLKLAHEVGGGAERVAAERRSHRRGLWGRGRCQCRTDGQNSSGTARGTFYLVKETSQGTFTKVKHGKVLVKNFRTGKKVLLEKGESYLARDKRG